MFAYLNVVRKKFYHKLNQYKDQEKDQEGHKTSLSVP